MQTVRGFVHGGAIQLAGPVVWPEGAEVQIQLVDGTNAAERTFDGGQQLDDSAAIAQWIAAFDALPALEMTREEEEAWQAARAAQRDQDRRAFTARIPSMGSDVE